VQGLGSASSFVPLSAVTFATLPSEFRTEAAGIYSLLRNVGSSTGISIVQTVLMRNPDQSRRHRRGRHLV